MTRALFAENAPPWLCLTSPAFACISSGSHYAEPDPVKEAARAVEIEARRVERERVAEIARAERTKQHVLDVAETKRLRHEASERRKVARANRPPLTHEERAARIRAGLARARAEGRLPPLRPKTEPGAKKAPKRRGRQPSLNKIAPEGRVSLVNAARTVGLKLTTLSNAIRRGALTCERKGQYVYVRVEDVREYMATSAEHTRESGLRNLAKARAVRIAKAEERKEKEAKKAYARPGKAYARLVKRGAA